MNAKILGAFLLAATLVQGCIVVKNNNGGDPPPPPKPGNVTFTWSFSGASCQDVPDVKSIHIVIPGESLQNDGIYPCLANNYPGIELHDFAPGSYSFTIDAISYSNQVLFTGSGNFSVNGDTRVTIDLTPVGQPNSYAYLTWRFPGNSTCEQLGVTGMRVTIDGIGAGTFNCADGFASPGVPTPYLHPGDHTILLEALNPMGYRYLAFQGPLKTFAGAPVSAEYHLNWTIGGVAISWNFSVTGTTTFDCAQAGVSTVYVNFQDQNGNFVYPGAGDPRPCGAKPVVYNYLQAGTYSVYVQASDMNGQIRYASNTQAPPMVTIKAGEFVDESNPLTLTAYRRN